MAWAPNSHTRSVPYRLQQACFRRDHHTCQQCGYTRQTKGDLHADHIIPRSQNGPDELANLITLCVPCHARKTQAEALAGRRKHLRPAPTHPSDA